MTDSNIAGPWAGQSSMRIHNRRTIMELLLVDAGLTRTQIAERTNLSRSTVSRIVDELIEASYLEEHDPVGQGGRGRPSRSLRVPSAMGQVIGVDVGVSTTRLITADLNATALHHWVQETPRSLSAAELAQWLADQITTAANHTPNAILRSAVVSFPAKVGADGHIRYAAQGLNHLEGHELYERLSESVPWALQFRSDPDMALRGEMASGRVVGDGSVVLFVVSSALRASIAINGKLLSGRQALLGEFGRMPFAGGDLRLGDVLSLEGITARSTSLGHPVSTVHELLGASDPIVDGLRNDFASGLTQMIIAVTLTVEPSLVIFAGRLLPLVADVLPVLEASLDEVLPARPAILLSQNRGFSQPLGAVEVALEAVRPHVLDDVADPRASGGSGPCARC